MPCPNHGIYLDIILYFAGDGSLSFEELENSLADAEIIAGLVSHVEGVFAGTGTAAPLSAAVLWPHLVNGGYSDDSTTVLGFLKGLSTFAEARSFAIGTGIDISDTAVEVALHNQFLQK